jgi:hypothetical protein
MFGKCALSGNFGVKTPVAYWANYFCVVTSTDTFKN